MLNVLCSISSLIVIIYSILVMIGHVREIKHMYQFAVHTSEDFEIQDYVKIVEDMDLFSLAANRKVWKAPLKMVMSLHVV